MAQVWNPAALQITAEGSISGQQYINRIYVRKQGAIPVWTLEEIDEAVDKMEVFLTTDLAPLLSGNLTFTEIRARVMAPDLALQRIAAVSIQGASVEPPMPNNVSACVTLSSGFAGRGGRGRFYVGAIPRTAVSNSTFDTEFVSDIGVAFTTGLLARFSETGTVPMDVVIYSQQVDGADRPTALLTTVLTAGMRDNVVDSQRRRLPGRGA